MKNLLIIVLCISMTPAFGGVGGLRYDCAMSGELNLQSCCCEGQSCTSCPDSNKAGEAPCGGCCEVHLDAKDDPPSLTAGLRIPTPQVNTLVSGHTFELAQIIPLVRPEFCQAPERSPPEDPSTPVRIRICSFLV